MSTTTALLDQPEERLLESPRDTPPPRPVARNVGTAERWISGLLGALIAGLGLRRRSVPGLLLAGVGGGLLYRGASGRCHLYRALGITRRPGSREEIEQTLATQGVLVRKAITVRTSPDKLYAFWRDLANLPRFVRHLRSVTVREDGARSHWVAAGPFGIIYEWDAEIVSDEPNRLIAWRSLESSDVDHAGTVAMKPAPGDRGTELRLTFKYNPRSGAPGIAVAKLFGEDPARELDGDLRALKQLLETGEVASTRGQPTGRNVCASLERRLRP